MRKTTGVIRVLTSVMNGASVYDITDAAWLRKFKDTRPDHITLIYSETFDPKSPIFRAELTVKGKIYLGKLRREHEVSGLRQTVS